MLELCRRSVQLIESCCARGECNVFLLNRTHRPLRLGCITAGKQVAPVFDSLSKEHTTVKVCEISELCLYPAHLSISVKVAQFWWHNVVWCGMTWYPVPGTWGLPFCVPTYNCALTFHMQAYQAVLLYPSCSVIFKTLCAYFGWYLVWRGCVFVWVQFLKVDIDNEETEKTVRAAQVSAVVSFVFSALTQMCCTLSRSICGTSQIMNQHKGLFFSIRWVWAGNWPL